MNDNRSNFRLFCFITCVKEELVNIQFMRMNYATKHSRDHDDSEYVSHVGQNVK